MSNNPESIVVVGASNAGKTTLVRGLRTPEYEGKVVVPTRFTTRPARLNEDPDENVHLEEAEFHQRVHEELINPHWARYFEDDRKEYYGFEPVPIEDGRLPIYAANNAFLRDVEGFRRDL